MLECAYILRYVEHTNRPGKIPWSLRQFAIYHRFKPAQQSRCSTWIIVGASERTKVRLDQYTRSVKDLRTANPFELHVIFLDTVITSWRPYISYLTELVSKQASDALSTLGLRLKKSSLVRPLAYPSAPRVPKRTLSLSQSKTISN